MKYPLKKRILLKISGEIFKNLQTEEIDRERACLLACQIKQLENYQWAIVIGGGNFFRGSQQGKKLGLTESTGHFVGILATIMNGLIFEDILKQHDIKTSLFAIDSSSLGKAVNAQTLGNSLDCDQCLIFTGGLGVPFFTTDTTAVVRALQIGAQAVWKLTKVPGIFNKDPVKNPEATLFKKIKYEEVLEQKLNFMDSTALVLARDHRLPIRVFSMYEKECLLRASEDPHFGSIVST